MTGTDPRDKICSDVMKRKEVKSRWCKTEILVIDEISMLSAEMFDILSFIGENRRE
jgi:ATP-dependent DNA helicase PIF1